MKRAILMATLAVTVAGIAATSLLTSTSRGVGSSAQAAAHPAAAPKTAAIQASAAMPIAEAKPVVPATAPAPTVQQASLETRQAPVPLLVKPRPAVNLPAVEAVGSTPLPTTTEQPAVSDTAASEGVAKAAIEADGYRSVRAIRKGDNGVWYAKALRGKTEVMLIVDATGSVSSE